MTSYSDLYDRAKERSNVGLGSTLLADPPVGDNLDFDDLIVAVESRIYRNCRALALIQTDSLTITPNNGLGEFTLPTNYIKGRKLLIDSDRPQLHGYEEVRRQQFLGNHPSTPWVAFEGLTGYVLPADRTVADVTFYGSLPSLLTTQDNSFVDQEADMWLYASMAEVMEAYEDDRLATYESKYQSALRLINQIAHSAHVTFGITR